jgi:hypothetical protein
VAAFAFFSVIRILGAEVHAILNLVISRFPAAGLSAVS